MSDTSKSPKGTSDLSPGKNEVYDSDSTNEWNNGAQYLVPYTNQTDTFTQSIPANMPRMSFEQVLKEIQKIHPEVTKEDLLREIGASLLEKQKREGTLIDQMVDKVKNTETAKDILEDHSDGDIVIEIAELGNGAAAETLPDGKILINKDIEHIDDLAASRLIHELTHHVSKKEVGYLEDPEEQEAFQKQIQFLIEKGYSEDQISEVILPLFEDYLPSDEAKDLLDTFVSKSNKNLEASLLNKVIKTSQMQALTFSAEEKTLLDKISAAAKELGITVFLAGGIVRDKLLGIPNEDLDFVTNKDSDKLALLLSQKYKLSQPIKMDRSGATMLVMGEHYLDFIDAEKVFSPIKAGSGESLEQGNEAELSIFMDDAYRRDLTINSLMYGLHTGKLYDPTGKGYTDLQNKIIRTIIDPYIKYRIHAPDMLRALRFYATKPGFKFAPDMLEAMKKNADKVTPRAEGGDISARRIERELRKANKDPKTWQRLKGALIEVGLDQYIGKQIEDVEKDMEGNIKYDFSEDNGTTKAVASFIRKFTNAKKKQDGLEALYKKRFVKVIFKGGRWFADRARNYQRSTGHLPSSSLLKKVAEAHDLIVTPNSLNSIQTSLNAITRIYENLHNLPNSKNLLKELSSIETILDMNRLEVLEEPISDLFNAEIPKIGKLIKFCREIYNTEDFLKIEEEFKADKLDWELMQIAVPILKNRLFNLFSKKPDILALAKTSSSETIRDITDEYYTMEIESSTIFKNLKKIAELEAKGSDYAGRELPNQPALPTTVNYPYLDNDHDNYNAEKTLKGKELEEKLNKVKDFVLKHKK